MTQRYVDTHLGAVGLHKDLVAASFTRPANTTAYSSGQLIANSTTAGSVVPMTFLAARDGDRSGRVRRAHIKCTDTAFAGATVRLHLYRALPTPSNGDGGAWLTTDSNYLGAIDVTLDKTFSDPCVKGMGVPNTGPEINFIPDVNITSIYGLLEARGSVTPASGKVFTVTLEVHQD